ncbi:RING/U-box superfamily protein [Striga asiatica]|uniref:RING-type E3 ubiquitin transferase n=1 Tax=Striga asiatica TaxID=4170 RepID=A0A5A7Q5I8_STRAF|nr:RING/U-box superfamily protein [Striga asiatica]
MKGHKNFVTTLTDNLSFEHGSTSNEPVTDSQISWTDMQTSPHNDYRTSTNEANCLLNVEWSLGETSSTTTHTQGENNERKRGHAWSHCQTSNILPPDSNIDLNSNTTQPRDLNMQAESEDPEHDSCHIIGNSSDLPSVAGEDGRRTSGKRKSLEVNGGQSSGSGSSTRPMENGSGPEQINSRLRPESFSRRNLRLRINGSQSRPLEENHSLHNHLLDLNPPPPIAENNEQTGLLRNPMLYEELAPRNVARRTISEHPEIGSTSRVGPISGVSSSRPQYSRRLSEIVRRSLLTSAGIESSGSGQSSRQLGPSQISSGPGVHGRHLSGLRAGLSERQNLDGGALGLPHSLRTLAAGGEGRTSLMSEIRHVLDLMQRGEGLRFEDVMVLDQSLFFGMSDIHDRHRDMRLDIDNMSYEELLALGERIGNVSTGINEETIMSCLKQTTNVNRAEDQTETEPCSICREEYVDGEDLGTLDCGHEFHKDCIKQWLLHKNLCPICKTTGLTK